VTGDAHEGLREAIHQVLTDAICQRHRVHFMRNNILTHIPKQIKALVAAALRTIFLQPDGEATGKHLDVIASGMRSHWPRASQILSDAEDDILAYMAFPPEHWARIYPTNSLVRLNREIRR